MATRHAVVTNHAAHTRARDARSDTHTQAAYHSGPHAVTEGVENTSTRIPPHGQGRPPSLGQCTVQTRHERRTQHEARTDDVDARNTYTSARSKHRSQQGKNVRGAAAEAARRYTDAVTQ